MGEELTIIQLKDKYGNPIAPFTLDESVPMANGKNAHEQIDYMNVDHIREIEGEVFESIEEATDNAVEDIQDSAEEYRYDINALSGSVMELDSYVFPLTISYRMTQSYPSTGYSNTITMDITEYQDRESELTQEYILKTINGGEPKYIYHPEIYSTHATLVDKIEGMREIFTFHAETATKSANITTTRYLCFYGASISPTMLPDIALRLNKTYTTGVSFNPTISTEFGQYIWLLVPNYLTINSVKSSGFDVTLNEPEMINVGDYGTYKAYRTLNALDTATWPLIIS